MCPDLKKVIASVWWCQIFKSIQIAKVTNGSRFANWTKFLKKCSLVSRNSIFPALPGAHALGRVHSPHASWLYDSESLSTLKSNMGAGEISFFELTDYLCVSHPSIEKISRLTLQNSLRMCPDLKKGYSFSLVVSNLQVYPNSKSYQ